MPAQFNNCVKQGGRIKTVIGKDYGCGQNEYRHICFKNGKSYLGEIKKHKKGK